MDSESIHSWLETVSPGIAGASHPDEKATNPPNPPAQKSSPLPSPPSTYLSNQHGQRTVRKRAFREAFYAQSDMTSNHPSSDAAESRSVMSVDPPIKFPHPSRPSRPASPVRNIIQALEEGTPFLRCRQPDDLHGLTLTEPATKLMDYLKHGMADKIIPDRYRAELIKLDPAVETSRYNYAFYTSDEDAAALDKRWDTIKKIHKLAQNRNRNTRDENAWTDVVRKAVRTAMKSVPGTVDLLEFTSIQTQPISKELLPKNAHGFITDKRADYALSFHKEHPDVLKYRSAAISRVSGLPLSQMEDAYTSTVPLYMGIEVKERGGNYNEAIYQISIWSMAGLNKCVNLTSYTKSDMAKIPAYPAITVQGHDWKVHVCFRDLSTSSSTSPGGGVYTIGPLATFSTMSLFGVCKLIAFLRLMLKWTVNVYWPWMKGTLEDIGNRSEPVPRARSPRKKGAGSKSSGMTSSGMTYDDW